MSRTIRVAAVQLQAHDADDFAHVVGGIAATARSAARDADLVVLPEATFPGYVLGDARVDHAAIGGALDLLRDIARDTRAVVVVGAALRDARGLRNAAVIIDGDGSIAGSADKIFLWHFDRLWFAPGERIAPVATSIGSLGVLVCADGRIPTIARELVDGGAQLLVMPTAWVTSGRNPQSLENVQADLLARVRARENAVPFVAANKCGVERGMVAYCGKSQIVDNAGNVLAIAAQGTPAIVTATVAIEPHRGARDDARPVPNVSSSRTRPMRVVIGAGALPSDIERKLELLGGDCALAPEGAAGASLDDELPCARVDDAVVLDPGALVAYRRAGYVWAAWTAHGPPEWIEPLARARALELRMYVVVFDAAAGRAYAVDPDGVVIAGTFGDYRLASFALDPRRTAETTVAPGTDVADALERVSAIVQRTASRKGRAEP